MLDPDYFDDYDEAETTSAKKRVQLELYKQQLYPYKCIGVVLAQTEMGEVFNATSFLVSSCLALTSAHTLCKIGKGTLIKAKPTLFFEYEQNGLNIKRPIKIAEF